MFKRYKNYPRKCHKIEHLYPFDFRTLIRVREMTTSINVLNSNTFFLRVFEMLILYLVENTYAEKFIRERRNQNPKSPKIFRQKVMTLEHWVSQL